MKPIHYREVKRKLEAAGFVQVGQTGSHAKFAKTTSEGTLTATVPKHRDVAPGTCEAFYVRRALANQNSKDSKNPSFTG